MKPRYFMSLVFGAAMVLGNVITADLAVVSILRAFALGLIAAAVFHLLVSVINRVTQGGVDRGLERMSARD